MRILIAYDGSDCAEAALDDLTRAGLPLRAEALVFAVVELWLPPPHPETYVLMPDTSQQPEIEEAERLALRAIERLKENFPEWTISAKFERGSPASEILNFAEDWHPDLNRRGIRSSLLPEWHRPQTSDVPSALDRADAGAIACPTLKPLNSRSLFSLRR